MSLDNHAGDQELLRVVRGRARPADVERILLALPGWFGIPSATRNYVESALSLDAVTAAVGERVVGVVLIDRHQPRAAELTLAAVEPDRHRTGIGRMIIADAEAWLRDDGIHLVQVKTLGEAHPSPEYAATRKAWVALGYEPLQEFTGLWPDNPCLVMVKDLRLS